MGWPSAGESDGRQQTCIIPSADNAISSPDPQHIKNAIRPKYTKVAISSGGMFEYPTGKTGTEALGYDPAAINEATPALLKSFYGVGNPFAIGVIHPGSNVLDIGSGAGFDLYVAKRMVGDGGRLQFADVVLERELPGTLVGSAEAWSQWIGGTIPVRDQINLKEEVGFTSIEFLGETGFHTSQYTVGALFKASKAGWSVIKTE